MKVPPPEKRLEALARALSRATTLQAKCVQRRRYLDPFSEIVERGIVVLKKPRQLYYSGELVVGSTSRPATAQCHDGKTLWTVRTDASGTTFEKQVNRQPSVDFEPLLGFFDASQSHFSRVEKAKKNKTLIFLKNIGPSTVSYALRREDNSTETVTLFLNRENLARQTLRQTTGGSVKTEEETILTELRVDAAISESRFAFAPPAGARPYVPPPLPLAAGTKAPALKLTLSDETPFELSRRAGETVVLDFWAPWCHPCVATFPELEKQAARGILTVLIPLYDSPENISQWIKSNGARYPNLRFATGGPASDAAGEAYRVVGIPATFTVAPDQTIQKSPSDAL
jgi:thiol-disulfide isomerase/thioredoxin